MRICRGKNLSVLQFVSLHIVYFPGHKRLIVSIRDYYGKHTLQNYCQRVTEV